MAKARKITLLSAKLIVATLLLAWVVSQVHWYDYVEQKTDSGIVAYSIVNTPSNVRQAADGREEILVQQGSLWRPSQPAWKGIADFTAVKTPPASQAKSLADVRRLGVKTALEQMNRLLLLAAVGCFLTSLTVIAIRWRFLLRIQDIHIGLWEAIRLTFLGQFFNTVIPGTVGGDLVKAYYVSKHTPRKAAVLVSIFVDRVLGLTELTLLAAIMLVIVTSLGLAVENIRQVVIALTVVVVLVIGAFTFLLSARFRKLLRLQKFYQRLPIAHHIAAAGDAAVLYRQRFRSLIKAVLFTFGAHILWITSVSMIGFSLHLNIPWYSYFLNIPLIYIVGAGVPLPGGVGGVEFLYLRAFSQVNPSQVLVLAILARLMQVVCGLPGLLVAITGPKLPKAAAMEAELAVDDAPKASGASDGLPESTVKSV